MNTSNWDEYPWRRPALQVLSAIVVFTVLGTFVFGDPLRTSFIEGLLFGVAFAAISAAFRWYKAR